MLTERQRCVLQTLVHLYIRTGQPVSSRLIARHLRRRLNLSPASIRNVMAELEEMGYLTHPHTSAGRIPTDSGYRTYVNSLPNTYELSTADRKAIQHSLQTRESWDALLQDASRVLSTLSSAVGISRLPTLEQLHVHRVELVPISSSYSLLVVIVDSKIVRTLLIPTAEPLRPEYAESATQLLNQHLCGRSLSEATKVLATVVRTLEGSVSPAVLDILRRLTDRLPALSQPSGRLFVSGTAQLFRYPEVASAERMRAITALVEEDSVLNQLLERYERSLCPESLFIGIGRELQLSVLQDYAIILGQYRTASARGVVGILGPKRMPYSKVIPIVRWVAQRVSELWSQT